MHWDSLLNRGKNDICLGIRCGASLLVLPPAVHTGKFLFFQLANTTERSPVCVGRTGGNAL